MVSTLNENHPAIASGGTRFGSETKQSQERATNNIHLGVDRNSSGQDITPGGTVDMLALTKKFAEEGGKLDQPEKNVFQKIGSSVSKIWRGRD